VALLHPVIAVAVNAALKARDVIPDFRPPDTIRLCPAPLYIRPADVDTAVRVIREILDSREYEGFSPLPGPVA
jgi:kynureninase